jgi:hypothetical protein
VGFVDNQQVISRRIRSALVAANVNPVGHAKQYAGGLHLPHDLLRRHKAKNAPAINRLDNRGANPRLAAAGRRNQYAASTGIEMQHGGVNCLRLVGF